MKNYFKYLKQKWGIESNFQFWLIFSIFGISGTSTLFIKEPIFSFFGLDGETSFWIKFLVYILTITPAYFVLLMLYGTIFGQFRFFSRFTMDFFMRIFFIKMLKTKGRALFSKLNVPDSK